jgi:hypothetical protein
MKNPKEEMIVQEIASILATKDFSVQCYSSGTHVPSAEMDRANAYGEAQLKKDFTDDEIIATYKVCLEQGFEDDGESINIIVHILQCLAEAGFETSYDNISFTVNI